METKEKRKIQVMDSWGRIKRNWWVLQYKKQKQKTKQELGELRGTEVSNLSNQEDFSVIKWYKENNRRRRFQKQNKKFNFDSVEFW